MNDRQATLPLRDTDDDRARRVAALLGYDAVRLHTLDGSGNNRLYRIEHDGPPLVAKWYVQDGTDRPDRQTAEWAFLRYAAACGLRNLPRAVGQDPDQGVTIMTMLPGQRPRTQVSARHVEAAARFVAVLNAAGAKGHARDLPNAAEAAFSLAGHSEILDARTDRLAALSGEREQREAVAAMRMQMIACHGRWRDVAARRASGSGSELSAVLPIEKRCISPSDFGFHNALIGRDDAVAFLDFEYAGWDDPAKLICDFFWQPSHPVDPGLRDAFATQVLAYSREQRLHRERIALLDPLFGLRWCCIILNPFLAGWASRHSFARPARDLDRLRRERIARARQYLERVESQLGILEH